MSRLAWPPPPQEAPRCALCGRQAPLTEHHLIPRSRGRRRGLAMGTLPTAPLCQACHNFLHRTFSNAQLEREYSSIAALREQEDVQRFVRWLRKQPASRAVRVR